ncbi:ribokinase [Filifactor villosus]|uniref:Ribokinase n=1 Tax=Filifactor villosus TaxID=29374 RepID=A0ABV9QNM7_9FIRM
MIIVVGSLNMDLVLRCDRIPKVGETVIGNDFDMIPGGKGANQAVALARLGSDVKMIGKVGRDEFAKTLVSSLEESGVDTSYLLVSNTQRTGVAGISVDGNGKNSIIVAPGANNDITLDEIVGLDSLLSSAEMIVLQNEVPSQINSYILKEYGNREIPIVWNPAPAMPIEEEYLRYIDFLIPNEHEIRLLSSNFPTDIESYDEYIDHYISKGVKHIIITLGEEGCIFACGEVRKRYCAYTVAAVDTTAAGDTFVGGFCSEYTRTKNIDTAIDFAMKAASISVTRYGAQPSIPYRKEIK